MYLDIVRNYKHFKTFQGVFGIFELDYTISNTVNLSTIVSFLYQSVCLNFFMYGMANLTLNPRYIPITKSIKLL